MKQPNQKKKKKKKSKNLICIYQFTGYVKNELQSEK